MTFSWRAKLVLPEGVEIVEVNEISPEFRAKIQKSDGDFVIYRDGSRESAKLIDADAVRLLSSFRKPRKIVDAVISMSNSTNIPSRQLLDESFSMLRKMVEDD